MSSQKRKTTFRRVLLKLSGETLSNRSDSGGIDSSALASVAEGVAGACAMGAQVAVVIGGGNIYRGESGQKKGINRATGDYMGMLATIINALALRDAISKLGIDARVLTAIEISRLAEPVALNKASHHLDKGRVVIFGGGTGNPFFTTDSAAALRACEIGANALLKATKVDGIYTADPMLDPSAKRHSKITFREALRDNLRVMDAAAFALCMDNNIPIIVFDFFRKGNIERVLAGGKVGTLVSNG